MKLFFSLILPQEDEQILKVILNAIKQP
ncbi:hypothetical protein PM8797T_05060 [Gimesia maris DSM 8797]|nr:hypothetical protein PM8797T_05060 [Gimesia maris DSM 8797]